MPCMMPQTPVLVPHLVRYILNRVHTWNKYILNSKFCLVNSVLTHEIVSDGIPLWDNAYSTPMVMHLQRDGYFTGTVEENWSIYPTVPHTAIFQVIKQFHWPPLAALCLTLQSRLNMSAAICTVFVALCVPPTPRVPIPLSPSQITSPVCNVMVTWYFRRVYYLTPHFTEDFVSISRSRSVCAVTGRNHVILRFVFPRVACTCLNSLTTTPLVECASCFWCSLSASPYHGSMVSSPLSPVFFSFLWLIVPWLLILHYTCLDILHMNINGYILHQCIHKAF